MNKEKPKDASPQTIAQENFALRRALDEMMTVTFKAASSKAHTRKQALSLRLLRQHNTILGKYGLSWVPTQ